MTRKRPKIDARRGMVLIVVLVVVVLLTFSALTFAKLMLTERRAVELAGKQAQTRALAQSGIELARIYMSKTDDERFDEGGHYDNPPLFQGRLVRDDASAELRGRVSLLSPALDEQGYYEGVRFGLEDESTRLNLSLLLVADQTEDNGGRQLLSALPGMTDEIADAILDWIDDDDGAEETRELGAESEYYLSLDPPYKPRNAPPVTVEELLLVRGVTPQLLFGLDVDRNGFVDAAEAGGSFGDAANVDNANGTLDRGWSAYLTTH
ncbi:MAG: general secretion pathway protein GspK, partial [Planctomycetales bacterium]|nr:general secretion pathway protein GspK [Planctomycetales bacterium]